MAERCGQCKRLVEQFDLDNGAEACDVCGHTCHSDCLVQCVDTLYCLACYKDAGEPSPYGDDT